MEWLAWLFVAKPLNIFLVGLAFVAAHLIRTRAGAGSSRWRSPLLFAALLWFVYAAWEWWILVKSPEADIRVDLLLIWPVLGLVSLWAIYRSLRGAK